MSSRIQETLAPGARVIALVAHYDDEVLFCGGTLLAARDVGAHIVIAVATSVETTSGPRYQRRDVSRRERLRRAARRDAFHAVCGDLGADSVELNITNLPQAASPDTAAFGHAVETLSSRLRTAIPDLGCDLFISHGLDGEYGHPQHICVARAAAAIADFGPRRLLFSTPDKANYRVDVDLKGKRSLIRHYGSNQPGDAGWQPDYDVRLLPWTGRWEWFTKEPTEDSFG